MSSSVSSNTNSPTWVASSLLKLALAFVAGVYCQKRLNKTSSSSSAPSTPSSVSESTTPPAAVAVAAAPYYDPTAAPIIDVDEKDLSIVEPNKDDEGMIQAIAEETFWSFNHFNASVALPPEWPSLVFTAHVVREMCHDENEYGLIIAEGKSLQARKALTKEQLALTPMRVLASAFIDIVDVKNKGGVAGCGPWSVAYGIRNKGLGRKLVSAILKAGEEKFNAKSFRLMQTLSNNMSFSLYANLGFECKETCTLFIGYLKDEAIKAALNPEWSVRLMTLDDVDVCDKMVIDCTNASRRSCLIDRLTHRTDPYAPYVLVDKQGKIIAFTSGLFVVGWSLATSESAWKALYAEVNLKHKELDLFMPEFQCIGRLYPELIKWILQSGPRIERQNNLMVRGEWSPINSGKYVYAPSIIW